jgi:hypothetical protein
VCDTPCSSTERQFGYALELFGLVWPSAPRCSAVGPNKVHDCIGHGPEMKPSKRYGQKSPVRVWFDREGKSSTWSASAIPGSCADFLGRSSGGIERYQPCAHTHVITLSRMSVFIQTAPGEFAHLRGGTSTNLVALLCRRPSPLGITNLGTRRNSACDNRIIRHPVYLINPVQAALTRVSAYSVSVGRFCGLCGWRPLLTDDSTGSHLLLSPPRAIWGAGTAQDRKKVTLTTCSSPTHVSYVPTTTL